MSADQLRGLKDPLSIPDCGSCEAGSSSAYSASHDLNSTMPRHQQATEGLDDVALLCGDHDSSSRPVRRMRRTATAAVKMTVTSPNVSKLR